MRPEPAAPRWASIDDWLALRELHHDTQLRAEAAASRKAGDLFGTALAEARLDHESIDWTPRTPDQPIAKVIPLQQRGALVRRIHPDVIA